MKIGDFLKTTKGKVVTLASGAGVIAVGIAVAVLMPVSYTHLTLPTKANV